MYRYSDGLISERLVTRFLDRNDVLPWAEFFTDPASTEFIPPSFFANQADPAGWWINRQLHRYAQGRYGLQALISRTSGEMIGQCGLLLQEADGVMELEVGYHILGRHRGRGYATEAARLFIDYASLHRQSSSVISIINVHNHRSCRVAEKNGLTKEKTIQWNGIRAYIYRIHL